MCLIIQCQPDKIVRVCLWPILTNILQMDRFALTVLCTSSHLFIHPNPHPPTAPRCYIHLRWRFNSVFKKTGNFSEEKSLRPNKKNPVVCILWNMKSLKELLILCRTFWKTTTVGVDPLVGFPTKASVSPSTLSPCTSRYLLSISCSQPTNPKVNADTGTLNTHVWFVMQVQEKQ